VTTFALLHTLYILIGWFVLGLIFLLGNALYDCFIFRNHLSKPNFHFFIFDMISFWVTSLNILKEFVFSEYDWQLELRVKTLGAIPNFLESADWWCHLPEYRPAFDRPFPREPRSRTVGMSTRLSLSPSWSPRRVEFHHSSELDTRYSGCCLDLTRHPLKSAGIGLTICEQSMFV
jgi:hypothetical protein